MKIIYIDPNNTTPQLNYPLIKSIQEVNKIDIRYVSAVNLITTNYYHNSYAIHPQYLFFRYTNRIGNKTIRRMLKLITYPVSNFLLLLKILEEKPDIIHYNWLSIPPVEFFFIKIYKLFRIKIVLTQHDYLQHHRKNIRFFEESILKTVDKIICLSSYVKRQFNDCFADKIVVIEHGNCYQKEIEYYSKKIRRKNNTSDFKILFIGSIRPHKGIELLLASVNFLIKEKDMNDIQLHIVGFGSSAYANKINKIIENKNLDKKVIFENRFLTYDELFKYIINTDIGILPYKRATQSGVPYVFISFHKPLVVTNVGGLPEQVSTDFSVIVKPEYTDLANGIIKIRNLIENEEIQNSYFKRYLDKNKWQNTVAEYIKLYNEMTN